jgi:hypothetical protein
VPDRLSARMELIGSAGRNLLNFYIGGGGGGGLVGAIKFQGNSSLFTNRTKITGTLHEDLFLRTFMTTLVTSVTIVAGGRNR